MSKNLMIVILAICMVTVLCIPAKIFAFGVTICEYNPANKTLDLTVDTAGKITGGNRFLSVTVNHTGLFIPSGDDTVEKVWVGAKENTFTFFFKNKVIEPVGLSTFTKTLNVEIITEAEIKEKNVKPDQLISIKRFVDTCLIYRNKKVGQDGVECKCINTPIVVNIKGAPLTYTPPTAVTPATGGLAPLAAPTVAFQFTTSSPLPAATVDIPYSQQLKTMGGAVGDRTVAS